MATAQPAARILIAADEVRDHLRTALNGGRWVLAMPSAVLEESRNRNLWIPWLIGSALSRCGDVVILHTGVAYGPTTPLGPGTIPVSIVTAPLAATTFAELAGYARQLSGVILEQTPDHPTIFIACPDSEINREIARFLTAAMRGSLKLMSEIAASN